MEVVKKIKNFEKTQVRRNVTSWKTLNKVGQDKRTRFIIIIILQFVVVL